MERRDFIRATSCILLFFIGFLVLNYSVMYTLSEKENGEQVFSIKVR